MITVGVRSLLNCPILGITLSNVWRIYATEMKNIKYKCLGRRGVSLFKANHETELKLLLVDWSSQVLLLVLLH